MWVEWFIHNGQWCIREKKRKSFGIESIIENKFRTLYTHKTAMSGSIGALYTVYTTNNFRHAYGCIYMNEYIFQTVPPNEFPTL